MDQLARAIDGLAEACRALEVPIVSGNVSLYNETTDGSGRHPILPTPTVAAVGLVRDAADIVTSSFKDVGHVVLLLGASPEPGLGGSEYQALKASFGGPPPQIDLAAEVRLQKLVLELARARLLASAHDVADGGLAVTLAEACATIGADVTIDTAHGVAAALFGEGPTRIVVSAAPDAADEVVKRAQASGVPFRILGKTAAERLRIHAGPHRIDVGIAEIAKARDACLAPIVGE